MKSYRLPAFLAVAFAIACGAASNPDVAARVGSQQLSITRLADILGNSQAPLDKTVALRISELWLSYQLVGTAGAHNDTISDTKAIDDGMWSAIENLRTRKFGENLVKTLKPVVSACNEECTYNKGDLIMYARHILILTPEGSSPQVKEAAKKKADALRAQITPANFAKFTNQTEEPGGKEKGGDLGTFGKGAMVPEFEKGVQATKPGEVSPVVQTNFGYHIIYRPTYAEVKEKIDAQLAPRGMQLAESTYFAKLADGGNIKIATNAVLSTKATANNPMGHLKDNTTLADYKGGKLTAGRMADWILASPPQQQLREQLIAAPDSLIQKFLQFFVRNELLLQQADSAKIVVDSGEVTNMRMSFRTNLTGAWTSLGVDPKKLADSAKSASDREAVAGKRVESYIDKLIKNEATFVSVDYSVTRALSKKYDWSINDAGLEKAVEKAKAVRATADSLRAKQGPPTPGAPPAAAPPAAKPPADAKKKP